MAFKDHAKKQLDDKVQRGRLNNLLPPGERDEEKVNSPSAATEKADSDALAVKKTRAASVTPAREEKSNFPAVLSPPKTVDSSETKPEKKIPFMSYLDKPVHKEFEFLYMDIKAEARSSTGKALAQSEMVQALIQFAADTCKDDTSALVTIAENIINNRPNK